MLRNLGRQSVSNLTRAQFEMFDALGNLISLTEDDRRRALDLDDHTWSDWRDFLLDGPLPSNPPLPEMLQRLSETAFNLAVMTEAREVTA